MNFLASVQELLFPPRCVLCGQLLGRQEADLCRKCRQQAPVATRCDSRFSFLAGWTAVWYYKDDVRQSLLRYKFRGRRSYSTAYGRLLAMKLMSEGMDDFDTLTWIPVSFLRKFRRGYDQVELIARSVSQELGVPAVPTLRKIRHTPPQSGIRNTARRRANVMGVYRPVNLPAIEGKRILLLDDIITTGATASEAAKVLMIAGAEQVQAAAVAAACHEHNNS